MRSRFNNSSNQCVLRTNFKGDRPDLSRDIDTTEMREERGKSLLFMGKDSIEHQSLGVDNAMVLHLLHIWPNIHGGL
jgi:hypothetical protein